MLRSRCRCGEPKRRWRLWGPECRERLRLGYNPRPPGYRFEYDRTPLRHPRTNEPLRRDPFDPFDEFGQDRTR